MAAPILAPPVQTPLFIDPGALYFYVFPQSGAVTAAVTPDADFSLVMYFGDPTVLALKWTSAIPADPVYRNIVVSFTNAEGTTTQSIQVKVGNNAVRAIPNITTYSNSVLATGQTVSVPMTSDIPATFTSASGLPASLHLSNNVVSGIAPATAGTYIVRLAAKTTGNSTIGFVRYWVIFVQDSNSSGGVNPGGGGSGGNIDFTTPPSATIRVLYDGDYTQAQQAGSPIPVAPIAADPKPYVYRIKYWQFLASYRQPTPGSAGPNGGYYVGDLPGSFHDIGGGVIEFVREFALVPDSRNEFESFVYPYQFVQCSSGCSIAEIPTTTLCRIQYDYFHLGSVPRALSSVQAPDGQGGGAPMLTNSSGGWQGLTGGSSWTTAAQEFQALTLINQQMRDASGNTLSGIELPHAPKVVELFSTVYALNGWGTLQPGSEILAEDATMKQWKGLIFERIQRFVVIFPLGQTLG
jgi:hypothetical protein